MYLIRDKGGTRRHAPVAARTPTAIMQAMLTSTAYNHPMR
jgi:hypothetical protein